MCASFTEVVCRYQAGSLIDLVLEFLRNPEHRDSRPMRGARDLVRITQDQFRKLQSFLKGVRVRSKLLKQRRHDTPFRPIGRLVLQAGLIEFSKGEAGIPTTVQVPLQLALFLYPDLLMGECPFSQKHFYDTYNVTLQYPEIFGVVIKDAVFPAEVLEVEELQPYKRKLAPDQQQQMLQRSITSPRERLKSVKDAVSGRVSTRSVAGVVY